MDGIKKNCFYIEERIAWFLPPILKLEREYIRFWEEGARCVALAVTSPYHTLRLAFMLDG